MKRAQKQILLPVSQPHLGVLSAQPLRQDRGWVTCLISPGSDTASSDTAFPPPAIRTSPGKVLCFLLWSDTAGLTGEKLVSHVSLSSSSASASPLPQGERDEKGAVG